MGGQVRFFLFFFVFKIFVALFFWSVLKIDVFLVDVCVVEGIGTVFEVSEFFLF